MNESLIYYPYGTSGFRFNENIMQNIAYDIGSSIGVLLLKKNITNQTNTKNLGIMITASHNIYSDNGVKIIDETGNMLQSLDEELLEDLVNYKKTFTTELSEYRTNYLSKLLNSHSLIIFGNDTRRSCEKIKSKIIQGVSDVLHGLLKFYIIDLGLCTTPEFHYLVSLYTNYHPDNTHNNIILKRDNRYNSYVKNVIYENKINLSNTVIDCANGDDVDIDLLTIPASPTLINTYVNDKEKLNDMCGSDYITSSSKTHHNNLCNINKYLVASSDMLFRENKLHASFDGDADRIIFYSYDKNNFHLMTGDHISILILKYIINSIKTLVIETNEYKYDEHWHIVSKTSEKIMNSIIKTPIRIAVVHTGYSNGGFMQTVDDMINELMTYLFENTYSKSYLHIVKIDRIITPTGVKNLINVANKYDISIYFEQNGHGSVIVNKDYGINNFKILDQLFNQTIGDAILNLVAVSYLLKETKTSNVQFKNLFSERESILIKVQVKNKNIYKTTNDETTLLEPNDIASLLNNIMNRDIYKNCRAFIRPSGTEDVVRLYVENNTDNNVNLQELASLINNILM
jgi:phosphoacetylglucosamine mutase